MTATKVMPYITNNEEKTPMVIKQQPLVIVSPKKDKLRQFFIHKHDAKEFSFKHYLTAVKRSRPLQTDMLELVRTSCAKLLEKSKYVEIDYAFLREYAKQIIPSNLNDSNVRNDPITDISHLSERNKINMSAVAAILRQFAKFISDRIIYRGLLNVYNKYESFDAATLSMITTEEITELFDLSHVNGLRLCIATAIKNSFMKIVYVLKLKSFTDFADYLYNCIDYEWIKSQTENLKDVTTVKWELTNKEDIAQGLGLTFAPTKSKIVRRCVVTHFKARNKHSVQRNAICSELARRNAFIYAINGYAVYNLPYSQIMDIIQHVLSSANAELGSIELQFGLHLQRAPDTVQGLLKKFVNDFSVLTDQYIYKHFYGENKHLKIYSLQSAQSIIMELYYNLFMTVNQQERNPIFNFKAIESLTVAVVDRVVPFMLLRDGAIKIKAEYRTEFDKYINGSYCLKRSDLEIEIIASAVCVLETLATATPINKAKLVYSLKRQYYLLSS